MCVCVCVCVYVCVCVEALDILISDTVDFLSSRYNNIQTCFSSFCCSCVALISST